MIDLERMRVLMRRLPSILWEIEKKEANATRITAPITGMIYSGSSCNRQEEANIMLISVRDAYHEALDELEGLRQQLTQLLPRLDDDTERAIIRLRYIYGYDPQKIAKAISYHPRTVLRKLASAERKLMQMDP